MLYLESPNIATDCQTSYSHHRTQIKLYVSTGGFTKEARYEADRANVPVRLLDLDGLVKLYVGSYDKADEETRALLPLTRIWWPA